MKQLSREREDFLLISQSFRLTKKSKKHTCPKSHDQDFKKGRNKWSMYFGNILHIDTGKYCQNLKTWGKSDF